MVFLAIMAAAGYYVFSQAVAGGDYVQVPDVFDVSPTQAEQMLAEAGLQMGPQKFVYSEKFPENRVIQQVPAAGEVVRKGRKVYPTVSRGAEAITVPDVQGQTRDAAVALIQEANFTTGSTARMTSNLPVDTVISQDPAPGRPLTVGGEIHLLLSAGAVADDATYMPSLKGMDIEEALVALLELGLTVDQEPVFDDEAAEGIVLGQRPAPGNLIRPGQRVAIQVRAEGQSRKVEVTYTVPFTWVAKEVRIDAIGSDGSRTTVFPLPDRDYVNGQPPRFNQGAQITQPFEFSGELTVEIFLDGAKVRSYYYEGEGEPVIEDFDAEVTEDSNA
ncbi:MAG: hypothetical protein AMXMBFR84_48580 [Candidatus Hydrogenedentota bacterium]